MVFGASSAPKLYIKIARFKGPNKNIRREKRVLEQIQKGFAPKVIFFKEIDGRDVLGLEGKPGFSMLSQILGQESRRQNRSLKFLEIEDK